MAAFSLAGNFILNSASLSAVYSCLMTALFALLLALFVLKPQPLTAPFGPATLEVMFLEAMPLQPVLALSQLAPRRCCKACHKNKAMVTVNTG